LGRWAWRTVATPSPSSFRATGSSARPARSPVTAAGWSASSSCWASRLGWRRARPSWSEDYGRRCGRAPLLEQARGETGLHLVLEEDVHDQDRQQGDDQPREQGRPVTPVTLVDGQQG